MSFLSSFSKFSLVTITLVCSLFGFYAQNTHPPRYQISELNTYEWRSIEDAKPITLLGGGHFRNNFDQDDDRYAKIDIGFQFDYYGVPIRHVFVTTNGTIYATDAESQNLSTEGLFFFENMDMRTAFDPNCIAVFWDDFYLGNGIILAETRGSEGQREFIVTWHDVKRMHVNASQGAYFQAVFQESTGDILFNYHNVEFGDSKFDRGNSATIGLSSNNSVSPAIYSFNQPVIHNGMSLRFRYETGEQIAPILTYPTEGTELQDTSILLQWEYGTIEPHAVHLRLGKELGGLQYGYYEVENDKFDEKPYPTEFLLEDLPTDGKPCYIQLRIVSKTGQSYTIDRAIYPPLKESSYTVFFDTGGIHYGPSYDYEQTIFLNQIGTDGRKTIVREKKLDISGKTLFSDIQPGDYELVVFRNSNSIGEHNLWRTAFSVTDSDLSISEPINTFDYGYTPWNASPSIKSSVYVDSEPLSFNWDKLSRNSNNTLQLMDVNFRLIGEYTTENDQFTWPELLTPNRSYYWSNTERTKDGNRLVTELRNMLFQIYDETEPIIKSPVPNEILTSNSLSIKWKKFDLNIEKWRIELRSDKEKAPYWEGEFPPETDKAYFSVLPDKSNFVYVTLSYQINNEWKSIEARYELPHLDIDIELLSPAPDSVLTYENDTFTFHVSGASKDTISEVGFYPMVEGERFDETTTINNGSIIQDGDFYSAKLNRLPPNGTDIQIVMYAQTTTNTRSYDSYRPNFSKRKSYNFKIANDIPGQHGYLIDDTIPIDWIDATQGERIPLKGTLDKAGYRTNSVHSEEVEFPFPFKYYGQWFRSARVTQRGFLLFGTDPSDNRRSIDFPSPETPNGVVVPVDKGFYLEYGGGIFYYEAGASPNRKLVIQWNKVAYEQNWAENDVTFQIILEEGTNEIVFQYLDTNLAAHNSEGNPKYLKTRTIGLENSDGTHATIYQSGYSPIKNNSALRFVPLD